MPRDSRICVLNSCKVAGANWRDRLAVSLGWGLVLLAVAVGHSPVMRAQGAGPAAAEAKGQTSSQTPLAPHDLSGLWFGGQGGGLTIKGKVPPLLPEAQTANALALDEPNHRVLIATRKPPKLIVFNTDTGKSVVSVPCAPLHDDMWFDSASKRIYVTGSEVTSVFIQNDADHYTHVGDVPTGFRAKTSILVPELNRLYIAVSGKGKPTAKLALQVYDVQP